MPLLPLNRKEITRARQVQARQRDAERTARAQLQAAQVQLNTLRAQGADQRQLDRTQARIEQLAGSARSQAGKTREQTQTVRGLSDALLAQRDPALLVESLDAKHPVLLMPVSIQTRYDDATTRLMIRIYPDVLHAYQHDPGLTPAELSDGRRYWTQRFEAPADSASPWKELSVLHGPMRAAYLVRVLTPLNLAQIGAVAEPEFDEAALPMSAAEAREVQAVALPDRFVAVGWRGGQQVLRKWGRAVADVLPMSALFDPLLVEDESQWNPFEGDRAWLVEYEPAVAAGMAITVTAADLAPGNTLAQGLDRLVVLGVDWTRTPDDAAALLGELLHNHQHAQGLAFVAQGTPTNNTAGTRAGFAADASDVAPALDPVAADAQAAAIGSAGAAVKVPLVADELAGAGARLQLLLGLPTPADAAGSFDATLVPGADLQEGATAGHMINALWSATLGYTLRYFWNPLSEAESLIDDDAIATLRAHAVRYLRPSGPLGALRVGNQPYGILPLASRAYKPRANSALERELLDVIGWFRGFWQAAESRVPTMQRPAPDTLHQLLASQPWSVAKRFWQVAGPAAVANYPDIKDVAEAQRKVFELIGADLLAKHPPSKREPFIANCGVRPKPHSLDAVAWVQRDPENPKQELPPGAQSGQRLHRCLGDAAVEDHGRSARGAAGDAKRREPAGGTAGVCRRRRGAGQRPLAVLQPSQGQPAALGKGQAGSAQHALCRVQRCRQQDAVRRPVPGRPRRGGDGAAARRHHRQPVGGAGHRRATGQAGHAMAGAPGQRRHLPREPRVPAAAQGRRARSGAAHDARLRRAPARRLDHFAGHQAPRPDARGHARRRAPRRLRCRRGPAPRLAAGRPAPGRQHGLCACTVAATGHHRLGAAQRPPRQPRAGGRRVQHRPALVARQERQGAARRHRQRPVDGGAARLPLRARAARRCAVAAHPRLPAPLPAQADAGRPRDRRGHLGARGHRRRAPGRRVPQGRHRRRLAGQRAGGRPQQDRADHQEPDRPARRRVRPAGRRERAPARRRQRRWLGRGDGHARQADASARAARHRNAALDTRLHAACGGGDAKRQCRRLGAAERSAGAGRAAAQRLDRALARRSGAVCFRGAPAATCRHRRDLRRPAGVALGRAGQCAHGVDRRARPVAAVADARQRAAAAGRPERGAGAAGRGAERQGARGVPEPQRTGSGRRHRGRCTARRAGRQPRRRRLRIAGLAASSACSTRHARCAAWTWCRQETASRPKRR